MAAACECCGQSIKPAKRAKRKPTITLGKGPSMGRDWQAKEYAANMQVKRGELVWCQYENATRFGARGDFVTPEKCAELEAAASETLDDRLARLAEYIESPRYALTAADVRYDYERGVHRYAPGQTQWMRNRLMTAA